MRIGLELQPCCGVHGQAREIVTVRACLIIYVGILGAALCGTSQADYRLNCRLMDPSDRNFKRWCMGEIGEHVYVRPCPTQGLCGVRVQNFKSLYSTNVGPKRESPHSTVVSTTPGGTDSVRGTISEVGGLIGRTLSKVGLY
jgi:hypothetical protein